MKAIDVIKEEDLIFWLKEFGEHAAEELLYELVYLREENARLKRQIEYGYHDARQEWEREQIKKFSI